MTTDQATDSEILELDLATRPVVLAMLRERSEARTLRAPEPRAPRTWLAAAAAAVVALVALGALVLSWREQPTYAERGVAALEQAARDERLVEYRLDGLDYAPFAATRGPTARPLEAARGLLEAAITEQETPETLQALARVRLAEGDAASAYDLLVRARSLAPHDSSIAVDAATASASRGAYDAALAELDVVLARDPSRLDALFNRALVLEHANRSAEAQAAWRTYLDADRSSPWADEARARIADGDHAGPGR